MLLVAKCDPVRNSDLDYDVEPLKYERDLLIPERELSREIA
ncbi:hypothetical protein HOV93_38520 [Planctomycetes bacterium FF15]|uniref:Uncharacterized protein n=1 Tax=Bremerella alba TaxID=980252 RepID=A0A7V9A8N1_9BACT|nr:hypothetical protein [Bremerella alba]